MLIRILHDISPSLNSSKILDVMTNGSIITFSFCCLYFVVGSRILVCVCVCVCVWCVALRGFLVQIQVTHSYSFVKSFLSSFLFPQLVLYGRNLYSSQYAPY
jgi:hypothetical protein